MRYRRLGQTDIDISEIGFGTGDTAGLIVRGNLDQRCHVVGRALELGVNYFDTSADYGGGLSETHLGETLRALRHRPFIVTKANVTSGDLPDMAGAVIRSVDDSLRRLGLEYLDMVQLHNPVRLDRKETATPFIWLSVEDVLGTGGALEGLERARDTGKIRFLGFNCEQSEPEAARRLIETGRFQGVNVWFDLLNPTAGLDDVGDLQVDYNYRGMLAAAGDAHIGVAVMRPLAGGVLTDSAVSGAARHPLAGGGFSRNLSGFQMAVEKASRLRFLSRVGQHTLAQAAMRFTLSHPQVTTLLCGFSDVAHLDEAVACAGAGPLDPDDEKRMHEVWRNNFRL